MADHFLFSKKPNRYSDIFGKRRIAARGYRHSCGHTGRFIGRRAIGSRKARGTEATISRLPGEILAYIFKHVQIVDEDDEFDFFLDDVYDNWCWLTITHVCRHWRDVAIGTQELWTYIDIEGLSGIEQMLAYLERSGTSQITVYYSDSRRKSVFLQCLHLALRQFHRIRELHIQNSYKFPESLQSALCRNQAPALRKFSLHMFSSESLDVKLLFNEEAPVLEEMSVQTNISSWDGANIVRSLRNSSIGTVSKCVTLKEVAFILSVNHNLERLWITSLTDDTDPNEPYPIQQPIELPFLKDIAIFRASFDLLYRLFEKVTMPNLQAWKIVCNGYPIKDSRNPKSIIPYISREGNRTSCETLRVTISPGSVDISADCDDILGEWEQGEQQRRCVTYVWDGASGDAPRERISVAEGVGFVCSVVDDEFWCSAKELTLEIEGKESIENRVQRESGGYECWVRLLRMFAKLEKLSVSVKHDKSSRKTAAQTVANATHEGLLKALARTHKDEDGTTHLMCPHLEELHLFGMNSRSGLIYLEEAQDLRVSCAKRLEVLEISVPNAQLQMKSAERYFEGSGLARIVDVVDEDEMSDVFELGSDSESELESDGYSSEDW